MRDAPAGVLGSGREFRLVLGVGPEDKVPQLVLRRRIDDRTQQREAAALAIDGIAPRRERHVAAAAAAPLPHGEANLESTFRHS